ncbi:MAG: histidine phosphotransferase family protein [Rhodomicrobium sp.]
MTANAILEDTALAALISSKICHDLAGQIGAINNGLELLEEENDEDTRYYALELIQNSAKAAWAQLDFNRLAFGAASSLGAVVPLAHVEQVARRYVENGKRRVHWQANVQELEKDHAKLLLALLAVSLMALPAGGDFYVGLSATKAKERSRSRFKLIILCRGRSARVPEGVADVFAGNESRAIDGRLVIAYYAARVATDASLKLSAVKEGEDVLFTLEPR